MFSDASLEGTRYVIYIRSINEEGAVHVSFVAANSKVPPRTTLSIPRLELCAAVDASVCAFKVAKDLSIESSSVKLYSDSKVVLGYIGNKTKRFTRYVSRRVEIILKSFPSKQWAYVATHENPGDTASRPQTFESLLESSWLCGPAFLWRSSLQENNLNLNDVELPEVTSEMNVLKATKQESLPIFQELFNRIGNWNKLLNVVQLIVRFIITLSERSMKRKGKLFAPQSPDQLTLAKRLVLRAVQDESFPEPKVKGLNDLAPFTDKDSLIRVGGRLKQSNLFTRMKHPLLLPGKHPVTDLIIKHYHNAVSHQGRVITSSKIREEGFFVLHGTSSVKNFIRKCLLCKKLRGTSDNQLMADLPFDRIQETPPFTYCGLDVFGPFYVSESMSTRKTSRTSKVWALVFICLTSKAVHIEMLSHMDTTSFKWALRRFFSIRGNCKRLRSDRGSNFIGAHNQDGAEINLETVQQDLSQLQCEWEFNPPHSSNYGGLWERSIRSFRKIVDASLLILGKRIPTREELHTFLCEAACIINNTPLYELSNDPNDELPITPAHLLTMKATPNPPPFESFSEADIIAYGRRRWRRVQAILDSFWNRWRTEYTHLLQRRQKWSDQKANLCPDDVVLLKLKSSRRNVWPLAKVENVKISPDGLVRSVTLLLPSSDGKPTHRLERPVKDLIPIIKRSEASCSE